MVIISQKKKKITTFLPVPDNIYVYLAVQYFQIVFFFGEAFVDSIAEQLCYDLRKKKSN